jgi:hypothetical protein
MKKVGSLIFVIFFAAQLSFGQAMIAKLKFEEAEEAFVNNNFELTISKLKEVETLLKSTNPKILYLQILSQAKIIEKNPQNDYYILENARNSCQKYLIEYENLSDNEDKYRDIYKASEKLKVYPLSIQAFDEQKKQIVFAEEAKETAELSTNKKADEDFAAFTFFQGYKSGLALEQAKLESPAFFKSASKTKLGIQENYNNKDGTLQLIVKSGKLAGNSGKLMEVLSDDANFTLGIKKNSDIVNNLTSLFNLNPTKTIQNYDQDGFKLNTTTFTWTKNGKSIIITYKQQSFSNIFSSVATYTQFDKQYWE